MPAGPTRCRSSTPSRRGSSPACRTSMSSRQLIVSIIVHSTELSNFVVHTGHGEEYSLLRNKLHVFLYSSGRREVVHGWRTPRQISTSNVARSAASLSFIQAKRLWPLYLTIFILLFRWRKVRSRLNTGTPSR